MFQYLRHSVVMLIMLLLGLTQAHASVHQEVRHIVKGGEYLVKIAEVYPGVTWRAIAKANRLQSPYVVHPQQSLVIPTIVQKVERIAAPVVLRVSPTLEASDAVTSEVVMTASGPAHVFDGMNHNDTSPKVAIEKLFDDVSPFVREQLLALVERAEYTPILLPVGYRIARMQTAEGVLYENVLIAPISDRPLLAACYALPMEDAGALLLIQEVKSWNWYRERIPIGTSAGCSHTRTGLLEQNIAPPSHVRRDEAPMPYAAIPRSQARQSTE